MAPPRAVIYLILTLALTVVVLTSASVAVQAQGVLPTATVLVDKLNVRSGPGTGYTRLGGVSANDSLTVVGQAQNCAWLKIETKTLKGWVSGQRGLPQAEHRLQQDPGRRSTDACPRCCAHGRDCGRAASRAYGDPGRRTCAAGQAAG